ncbi:MAG: 2-oxoglutarate and iron-dependent oxygenase domain-containing protein, partial [Parvibaculales bacterium]
MPSLLSKSPFTANWPRAWRIYHVNVMSGALPVIDFSAFGDDSAASRAAIADEIGAACRETGFFAL